MKKTWFKSPILVSLSLVLLLGLIVPAGALDFSIQIGSPPPPPRRPLGPPVIVGGPRVVVVEPVYADYYTEAELRVCSDYFELDYPVVYSYYRDYGLTPDEVVYVLYLAQYSRHSPYYVIRLHERLHSWRATVRALHLSYRAPSWLLRSDAPTYAVLYVTSDYYAIPYSRVYSIYRTGYPAGEIVVAFNFSSRTNIPVRDVLVERNKGKKWEDLSRDHKTSFDEIKTPHERGKHLKFNAPMEEKDQKPDFGKDNNQRDMGKDFDKGKKDDSKGHGKDNNKSNDKDNR